ncbi:MAG: B12-binding domain-containing radical SAM protein [Elusimicrobia bacterium]|nr:B12-binding domain-containing radical SAM protein [Candidatus Liberimonas magnetica]
MKILLIFPKWTQEYGMITYFARKASVWPPLNLAYLAAIAEDQGHTVKIIDGEAEDLPVEKMVVEAGKFAPDIIGMTATTPFFRFSLELAKRLKSNFSKVPIVIGGPHISVLKKEAFYDCFDYGFIGESDGSWQLFLKCIENKGDISQIKGILYREKEEVKFTGQPDLIADVDSIPVPARHLLKLNRYNIGTLHGTKNFTTVMTSRGCPFKCIFCSTDVFGKKLRQRSIGLVIDEITSIISKFNIRHIIFLDDTLTIDKKYIMELCDNIISRKLNITFDCGTRANLVDEELIKKMAEAGLIRISFGLESVDENIRRIMKKEVPLESYKKANEITNRYNIETLNSCMIGLPGKTKETVRNTLHFLRSSKEIKQANISIAVPYPGTELYEMAKKGEHALKLETNDFSKFIRYGGAVMSVGSLSPQELIRIQNDAFISIYLAPWRWVPVLRKSGVIGLFLTFLRFIKSFQRVILNTDGFFWFKD